MLPLRRLSELWRDGLRAPKWRSLSLRRSDSPVNASGPRCCGNCAPTSRARWRWSRASPSRRVPSLAPAGCGRSRHQTTDGARAGRARLPGHAGSSNLPRAALLTTPAWSGLMLATSSEPTPFSGLDAGPRRSGANNRPRGTGPNAVDCTPGWVARVSPGLAARSRVSFTFNDGARLSRSQIVPASEG